MWGRRDTPADELDVHECTPFIWNPAGGATTSTTKPTTADGTEVNLSCAGHAFLPDGRLLVVGGHLADSDGLSQAALFDWRTDDWTPAAAGQRRSGKKGRRARGGRKGRQAVSGTPSRSASSHSTAGLCARPR